MPTLLGQIDGEGFLCSIWEDDDGRVHFVADADIDADGANGQNHQQAAYTIHDDGSDYLLNGGMMIDAGGKVVCKHHWARNVIILDDDNEPKVFPGGIIASKTWYRIPGKSKDDPGAYLDSEAVPYVVVPPLVVKETVGVVRGCKARVTYQGMSVDCVVADISGRNSIGELSIAAAKALGMPFSPKHGGVTTTNVFYELWPGVAAPGYVLQPA